MLIYVIQVWWFIKLVLNWALKRARLFQSLLRTVTTLFIDPVNCGESSFLCQKRLQADVLYSLARNVPVPDKTKKKHLFVSLVVSKHFCLVKQRYSQLHQSTTGSLFPCFMPLFKILAIRTQTNQTGSYHLRGIISGVTHQKWICLETSRCVMLNTKRKLQVHYLSCFFPWKIALTNTTSSQKTINAESGLLQVYDPFQTVLDCWV